MESTYGDLRNFVERRDAEFRRREAVFKAQGAPVAKSVQQIAIDAWRQMKPEFEQRFGDISGLELLVVQHIHSAINEYIRQQDALAKPESPAPE